MDMQKQKKRILIIANRSFSEAALSLLLTDAGYAVLFAETGESGLRLAGRERPDLLIVDTALPDMDSFAVCRHIRSSFYGGSIPILMLSSGVLRQDMLESLRSGANVYLPQSCRAMELLAYTASLIHLTDRNRSLNPLTGLSGNLEIQRELTRRIASGQPYAIIYGDLDNFKAYNDKYGFVRGDRVIQLTADILADRLSHSGDDSGFLGHIGGDDFLLATAPQLAEPLCKAVIEAFDRSIPALYDKADRLAGAITAANRKGVMERFPIMTISLAVVTNRNRYFPSHLAISDVASELKGSLKRMSGSNYLFDRRHSPDAAAPD
ncbi:response regulator [Ruminococcaceae bacterium OttesenSCG-928-L11]|nr:response regulator [Ruminococcaceae bacterium OttesenSCG-928-L11]